MLWSQRIRNKRLVGLLMRLKIFHAEITNGAEASALVFYRDFFVIYRNSAQYVSLQ